METNQTFIGRAENLDFPEFNLKSVPARIDTGAKTSSIWASNMLEADGGLQFSLFGPGSPLYSGQLIHAKSFTQRAVASSNGQVELRYVVKLVVVLKGRKIKASFTLANRQSQAYPVLVGRNILRGKFIVNVKLGKPQIKAEKLRHEQIGKEQP